MYIGIINAMEKERIMKKSVPVSKFNIPFRNIPSETKKLGSSHTICKRVQLLGALKEHGIVKPAHVSFNYFFNHIRKYCAERCGEVCFGTKGVVPLTGIPLHQLCKKN